MRGRYFSISANFPGHVALLCWLTLAKRERTEQLIEAHEQLAIAYSGAYLLWASRSSLLMASGLATVASIPRFQFAKVVDDGTFRVGG
jgi:hypothetical protein